MGDHLFQKSIGRICVSPWPYQNAEPFPAPVHGAPQPHFHAIYRHDAFIEVPLIMPGIPVGWFMATSLIPPLATTTWQCLDLPETETVMDELARRHEEIAQQVALDASRAEPEIERD